MAENKTWRAILVDDEDPAREILAHLLRAHPSVTVVGQASSADDAVTLCRDLRPDLILLDVQMPRGDGFSVLPRLEPLPAVIFVTSHDNYAVRAFEVNAVDYLLKPIDGKRLSQALTRVMYQPKPALTKPFAITDRVILETENQMRVTILREVTGIEAEGNYTRVHLSEGSSFLMRRTLKEWDESLPRPFFERIHRSQIVQLNAIREITIHSRDNVEIAIRGYSTPILISRLAHARLGPALKAAQEADPEFGPVRFVT